MLVRTLAYGICGGDLSLYENRAELASGHLWLGHVAIGVVTGIRPDAATFAPGHLVTALSMPAYAGFFVRTPDQPVKRPPEVDPVFALGESIACCVHPGACFGTPPGDRVAVVVCSFMGLVCLQIAR